MLEHAVQYDLSSAVKARGFATTYPRMFHLVEQTLGAASSDKDLEIAQGLLDLASKFAGPNEGDDGARIAGALVFQAIVLYARATTTSSKNRRYSPITGNRSTMMKAKHSRIVKIRNDAIAHFGYARDDPAGYWAKDTLVLNIRATGVQIAPLCQRVNYRGDVVKDLLELLNAARVSVGKIVSQKSAELLLEIEKRASDSNLSAVLKRNLFDFSSFYVSEAAACDARRAAHGGSPSKAWATWRFAGESPKA